MSIRLATWGLCLLLPSMAAAATDVGVGFQPGVYRGQETAPAASVLVFSIKGGAIPAQLQEIKLDLPPGMTPLDQAWALSELRAKASQDLSFTWFGPRTLRRAAPLQQLDPETVVAAAHDALAASLQGVSSDYTLEPTERPQVQSLQQGSLSLKAKPPAGGQLRSRMAVQVDVYVDGAFVETVPVWFAVRAAGKVPVFSRDMRAEQEVSAADIRWTTGDVAALASPTVHDDAALAGMWLRRPVQAGTSVLQEDLAREPLVRHNQRVQVQVVSGGVSIVAWGTAEQSGDTGDLVDVRVDMSEGPCKGRVIATGVVQIGN